MKEVYIRQAEKDDLPAMEWDGEYTHFRRLYADTFSMVQQGHAIMWIAELNGSGLIGQCFISLKGNRPELADGISRAYLYGFRVRPNFRNQGIGTQMMNTIEADLKERGFKQATLNVGLDNLDARRFYNRLGYLIVGSEPGFWSFIDDKGKRRDVHEPAWRMVKDLV
jgi:ribosomal protein S18 acetylase RimI-like enzyme